MKSIVLPEHAVAYLQKIYGKWFNLIAAGTLFISYALCALWIFFFNRSGLRLPYGLLYWYPGAILLIMGFFFGGNALWLRFKKHEKNDTLLARGIFDILSGLFILMFPRLGALITMVVMGLVLVHLGVKFLTSADSNVWEYILSIVFISVGVSNLDVINYILPSFLRILIFALFMGGLGVFLYVIAGPYLKATEPEDHLEEKMQIKPDTLPSQKKPADQKEKTAEQSSAQKQNDEQILQEQPSAKEND